MTQSEEMLEQGLIKALQEMSYEYVSIKEEDNLYANFKLQLEKHNRKELALHGREHFTDKEFDKENAFGLSSLTSSNGAKTSFRCPTKLP